MVKIGSYLYLAMKDLKSAHQISEHGDTGLFARLCEQAIEKAFKHFIHLKGVSDDQPLLFIHKPYRLYKRCKELGIKLEFDEDEKDVLRTLDDYYFDTNYPGNSWFEPEREDVTKALKLADKIVSNVEKCFEMTPSSVFGKK